MLAFWVFVKDFLIFARNKQTFILLIAMPLMLIAILGAALSGLIQNSDEEAKLSSFNIAVIDKDQSEESFFFVDDILIDRLFSVLNVTKMDESKLDHAFKTEQITLAVIIPEGFGNAIEQHDKPSLKLVSQGDASIEESIITIAALHYQNLDLAISKIVEKVTRTLVEQSKKTGQSPEMSNLSDVITKLDGGANSLRESKNEMNVRMGSKTVGSFQYYAVGMGVMYLLITVTTLVSNILVEKEDPVYLRQFVSNLTPQQYLLGKYLSLIAITFIQLSITIIGTNLLFNVDWGDSILCILFTMLTTTISTSALGLFIGSLIKKASTFTSMSMVSTQILAALGGSFVPIYLFPDWMVTVTKVLPNSLGLQMFLDIMTGATFADIWQEGVIALVVSLLLFAVSWIRLSRKGGAIHV